MLAAIDRWTAVTPVESIPPREGRAVCLGGKELAIFNLNGRFLTIENRCPHKGGPLCDGIVSGATVVCPLHGRRFSLETGLAVLADDSSVIPTYPTCVDDGIVYVKLQASNQDLAGC